MTGPIAGWASAKPRSYAASKRSTLLSRQGDRRIMEPMTRARDEFFPGLPIEATLGMTAFSSMGANTTEASRAQPFHELGPFDVEGGPRFGPAPNPNPRARYNTYGRVALLTHRDAIKRILGGRDACMTHNCWKQPAGWPDAIACGMAGLRSHYDTVYGMLDPSLRPSGPHTSWGWLLTMTAFSRGDTQASRVVNPYKVASAVNSYRGNLASVAEDRRWRALRRAVADTIRQQSGPAIGLKTWKMGAAYALVRSEQKYESGALIAGTSHWFADRYTDADRDDEDVITRHAYTQTTADRARDVLSGVHQLSVAAASATASAAMEHPVLAFAGIALALAGIVIVVKESDS